MGKGKKISQEMIDKIIELGWQGMYYGEIAAVVGCSNTTVGKILRQAMRTETAAVVTHETRVRQRIVKNPMPGYELPKRKGEYFDVLVYNMLDMPGHELTMRLKYYPNLEDMLELCHSNGLMRANDFEDVGDWRRGKEIDGVVLAGCNSVIGEYMITRLVGEETHPQEMFR